MTSTLTDLPTASDDPVVLELGGKSAKIVFADANLGRAAVGAIAAIFSGAGQSCVAGSRLLVERSARAELVDRIVDHVGRLKLGDPLDPTTEIGPIISSGPGVIEEYTQTKAVWVPTQPVPSPFPSIQS